MLSFDLPPRSQFTILCLGAHSDDIEIGCGGTILQLLHRHDNVSVRWVVFGAEGERADEAWRSAEGMLSRAREKEIVVKGFRDGFFPYTPIPIKEYFEELKGEVSPDLIFTHYRTDRHQDHRLISDLTWNTFRNHLILEYEIPKWDGDIGNPNIFVPLERSVCHEKVKHLMEYFPTQRNKQWFDEETFLALLRLRGMESNAPSTYAEAFYGRKLALFGQPSSGAATS